MNKDKLITNLDKLNAFLEGASEGLSVLQEILVSDEDSSPKLPVIPNDQEVEEYLNNLNDYQSPEAIALYTYRMFADSMSKYSSFLVEQWDYISETDRDAFSKDFECESIQFILGVLYELHLVFDAVRKIKLNSDQYNNLLGKFHFAIDLMCSGISLNESYNIEFFDDLSELWGILIGTIDTINAKYDAPLFSDFLSSFYMNWAIIDEHILSILNGESSKWTKKRALKKYVKVIKKASKKMSNNLQIEASFLKDKL